MARWAWPNRRKNPLPGESRERGEILDGGLQARRRKGDDTRLDDDAAEEPTQYENHKFLNCGHHSFCHLYDGL